MAGYVATEPLWGVQALYVGYFAHLLARVIYLTAKWRRVIMNYEKIVRSGDKNFEGEGNYEL